MDNNPKQRLHELGITLPTPPSPVALYSPVKLVDISDSYTHAYVSGVLPIQNGELIYRGVVGKDVDEHQAQAAASLCALNILALLDKYVGIEKVSDAIQIVVFVCAVPTFERHSFVADAASRIINDILGAHTRAAVGVASLPLGSPVEVSGIFLSKR